MELNNCIGAMDGKHVLIRPPPNTGSYYFNYKHSFSSVLLAIVDADYRFIYTDVGCNGWISDGGVFKNCSLYRVLEEKQLSIPKETQLPGTEQTFPFVIVADDAFPLRDYIMKPYSQNGLTVDKRVFNYRLSHARRVVENAFGILANRFRVFMTPMNLGPEKVETITLACCILHNFLRSKVAARTIYMPPGSVDVEDADTHIVQHGEWHEGPQSPGLQPFAQQGSNQYSNSAKHLRDILCQYFASEHTMAMEHGVIMN